MCQLVALASNRSKDSGRKRERPGGGPGKVDHPGPR